MRTASASQPAILHDEVSHSPLLSKGRVRTRNVDQADLLSRISKPRPRNPRKDHAVHVSLSSYSIVKEPDAGQTSRAQSKPQTTWHVPSVSPNESTFNTFSIPFARPFFFQGHPREQRAKDFVASGSAAVVDAVYTGHPIYRQLPPRGFSEKNSRPAETPAFQPCDGLWKTLSSTKVLSEQGSGPRRGRSSARKAGSHALPHPYPVRLDRGSPAGARSIQRRLPGGGNEPRRL